VSEIARQAAWHADAEACDDAALIARSLRAPESFGLLFDRHAAAIGRYIARRLGANAAEDLVAETFLVAFRRRGRHDSAYADTRPWLYGIATRLIDKHRRDEVRFFRAIARSGVDPAAEPVAGQVTDRVAAQVASRALAARRGIGDLDVLEEATVHPERLAVYRDYVPEAGCRAQPG
jgi:RNA polymerase sigma-70 factor (ECF subfamily)